MVVRVAGGILELAPQEGSPPLELAQHVAAEGSILVEERLPVRVKRAPPLPLQRPQER